MHSIRLRHPWQSELHGNTTVWSRKFNWPAEPTPGEIVQLVVEPISSTTTFSLNDTPLTPVTDGRFDITALIAEHNRLMITTAASPPSDTKKFPFEVRLEIEGN